MSVELIRIMAIVMMLFPDVSGECRWRGDGHGGYRGLN